MKTNIHFWSYIAHFFLEWKAFHTNVVEKIKTHILCSVTAFRKSCRLRDNVENIAERSRPQMTIWRMRIACWIHKYRCTLGLYNVYCFSTKQWLHERSSALRYTYITCLVFPLFIYIISFVMRSTVLNRHESFEA